MLELLHDPEFWVLVSFVIVLVGLVRKAGPLITKALDDRAAKISAELEEAHKLREEAQRMLAEYQRKQRDALKEAEEIVAHARVEAERAAEQAARDLDAALERRKRLAIEKIALAESKATSEVRNTAVDIAIAAVREILAKTLDAPRKGKLIDEAIADLPQRLH
ncbi:MAG TPA: F0F1 ATP synthase subunit B [Stellaceae bacterium]|nr:F0F1 ATP synthase subunit B [Stellaceae bacterium]